MSEVKIMVVDENGHVKIMKPKEDDSDYITALKIFTLACMKRADVDDAFQTEVLEWLSQNIKSELER